jgi:hypothetical protein
VHSVMISSWEVGLPEAEDMRVVKGDKSQRRLEPSQGIRTFKYCIIQHDEQDETWTDQWLRTSVCCGCTVEDEGREEELETNPHSRGRQGACSELLCQPEDPHPAESLWWP